MSGKDNQATIIQDGTVRDIIKEQTVVQAPQAELACYEASQRKQMYESIDQLQSKVSIIFLASVSSGLLSWFSGWASIFSWLGLSGDSLITTSNFCMAKLTRRTYDD